jgi:hypothetical protein
MCLWRHNNMCYTPHPPGRSRNKLAFSQKPRGEWFGLRQVGPWTSRTEPMEKRWVSFIYLRLFWELHMKVPGMFRDSRVIYSKLARKGSNVGLSYLLDSVFFEQTYWKWVTCLPARTRLWHTNMWFKTGHPLQEGLAKLSYKRRNG